MNQNRISLHTGRDIEEDIKWSKQETPEKMSKKSRPNHLKKSARQSNKRKKRNKHKFHYSLAHRPGTAGGHEMDAKLHFSQ
jgi:hypothetical protein